MLFQKFQERSKLIQNLKDLAEGENLSRPAIAEAIAELEKLD